MTVLITILFQAFYKPNGGRRGNRSQKGLYLEHIWYFLGILRYGTISEITAYPICFSTFLDLFNRVYSRYAIDLETLLFSSLMVKHPRWKLLTHLTLLWCEIYYLCICPALSLIRFSSLDDALFFIHFFAWQQMPWRTCGNPVEKIVKLCRHCKKVLPLIDYKHYSKTRNRNTLQ